MGFDDSYLTPMERFNKYTEKTDSCWIWKGYLNEDNRGFIRINKKRYSAHRFSYMLFKGEIKDKFVLHKCDNGSCVNPDHLFLGTQKENIQDCIDKKRKPLGEKTNSNKLLESEVLEIRRINKLRYIERDELARMFSVSRASIIKILKNKSWKHIQTGGDLSQL